MWHVEEGPAVQGGRTRCAPESLVQTRHLTWCLLPVPKVRQAQGRPEQRRPVHAQRPAAPPAARGPLLGHGLSPVREQGLRHLLLPGLRLAGLRCICKCGRYVGGAGSTWESGRGGRWQVCLEDSRVSLTLRPPGSQSPQSRRLTWAGPRHAGIQLHPEQLLGALSRSDRQLGSSYPAPPLRTAAPARPTSLCCPSLSTSAALQAPHPSWPCLDCPWGSPGVPGGLAAARLPELDPLVRS